MVEDYHDDIYQFMEILVIKTCVTVANPVYGERSGVF